MRRKVYSVDYVKRLEKEAKRPAKMEDYYKKIVTAMLMFLEHKDLEEEFAKYLEENDSEITELLDEG